uniref:Biotin carboxyl carrier protein of acetyl-CoA carboxylase n=1 Tax=Anthurium amnicola TaxID=1678845 RepID=A0A1D1YPJ9_9ARAE
MAACSIGGSFSVRCLNIDIYKTRCAVPEAQNATKFCQLKTYFGLRGVQIRQHPVHFSGSSTKPWRFSRPLMVACESTSQENSSKDCSEEKESRHSAKQFMPNSSEVQSLLTNICDTTSIAEFKLDFGGFRLYVKRGLEEKSLPPPLLPQSTPPSHIDTSNQNLVLNGSPASTSLSISKPKPSSIGIQKLLDAASDEGLVVLQSPKVGFFRRSRTIKGKRAPPSCQEKQEVKEGQVLCYIEQLGGEIPIESDVSGEVIKILREDGEPVGYNDSLIAILPSFPGIKKLQQ